MWQSRTAEAGIEWWSLFADDASTARALRRHRGRRLAAVAVATLVVALIAVLWLMIDSGIGYTHDEVRSTPSTSSESSRDPDAAERLLRLLPRGSFPEVCAPAPSRDGAVASVTCPGNDRDGPTSATFTLMSDRAALRAAFAHITGDSGVVNCPGGIQSPGPWHRSDTPQLSRGELVCTVTNGAPSMAWTTDDELLISSVRVDRPDASLDALFQWWSRQ